MELRHFKSYEFDSPDLPNSGTNMQQSFLLMLDEARHIANIPFHVNSGYRTKAHNESKKVGGKPNSAHLRGYAADIKANNSINRMIVLKACIEAGFTRIGIMQNAIHVDSDPSLNANVLWTYYK